MDNKLNVLLGTVIENDYCIGCGVCSSVANSPFTMELNKDGMYRPILVDNDNVEQTNINIASVCPFSNESKNETEIGKEQFNSDDAEFNKHTGYYLKNYAGYVKEDTFREKGSSGGMGNWIAAQLLEKKLVDGIIHVKDAKSDKSNVLFEYQISNTLDELSEGAKSKYYPIELSKVLELVRENEGKYALIGIPCFIKSVRLLASQDKLINERIKFFIGLVCGHLKSDMFAKSIGWQLGIEPENLTNINFRKKLPNRAANDYGVEVEGLIGDNEVMIDSPTKDLFTTNWGQGYFKYNACEFCDDVLAETADITVGDAWLPEYKTDYLGTNIITVRHPELLKIIEENIQRENIHLEELTPEKVYDSQAGGFRHRREGLSHRLHIMDIEDKWRPNKRVEPSDKLDKKRKSIYEKRMVLSQESFKAYKQAEKDHDFNLFKDYMAPLIQEYHNVMRPSLIKRVINKMKWDVLGKAK